jgi:imidazolonepropionase-like amidohydrolase
VPRLLLSVGLCLAALLTATGAQQAGPAVVLPNVTIIDGTGAAPRPAMTLVVRDGRIAEIFGTGDRETPAGAQVLATDGRFVTPGFIDTHVHLAVTDRPAAIVASLLRATLMGGVTTVRDMGGNGAVLARLRATSQTDPDASPDILTPAVFAGADAFWFADNVRAGYFHDGEAPGAMPWLVKVEQGTNLREAVLRAKTWGATGISVDARLTGRQIRTIADAARRERLPVWAHSVVWPATPRDAVDARVNSLYPAIDLVWQGRTGLPVAAIGTPAGLATAIEAVPVDAPAVRELLDRMRERQVALEPTLFAGVQAAVFAGDERAGIERHVAWSAGVTALARERGVMVLAGTDAVGGSSPNLHVELQLLVARAGFSPLDAIRAATFDAARALGIAGTVGSITVGRRADLVVLVRNPADDIRNTQTVLMVMRNGVVQERTDPMPVPPLAEAPAR